MEQDIIEISYDFPRSTVERPLRLGGKRPSYADDTIELVSTKPMSDRAGTRTQKSKAPPDAFSTKAESKPSVGPAPAAGAKVSGRKPDFGDTLPATNSVEEVRQWLIDQQAAFNGKVSRGLESRVVSSGTRSGAEAILNESGATSVFTLTNDHLMLEAFDILQRQLHGFIGAMPDVELAFVTIISGDGGTSLNRPIIALSESQARVRGTLAKMAPNYFAMTELGFFNSITHVNGGRHLQRHEHALVWGPGVVQKAREFAIKHSRLYTPNVTGADVIDVQRAWDTTEVNLARLAGYILKAPAKAMNWCPPRDGKRGFLNHSEAGDRYINHLRLAQLRSMLTFEDMAFGSRQGLSIRKAIVDLTRKRAIALAAGRCVLHFGQVPTFWVDFAKEFRCDDWALPAFLRG